MAWFSHGWRAILHYRNLPIGGAFSLFTKRAEKYRQKCQKERCKRNKSWAWFKSKGSKAKEKKTITSTLFSFLFSFALEFQRENLKTTLFSIARLVAYTDSEVSCHWLRACRNFWHACVISNREVTWLSLLFYFIILTNFAAFWQSTVFVDFRKKWIKTKNSWCYFAMNFLQTLEEVREIEILELVH